MAKMRHWKQRFRADAEMVWNRHGKYGSVQHKPGDPVPEGIGRSRLRLWFENHRIRLADPKGAPAAKDPVVEPVKTKPEPVKVETVEPIKTDPVVEPVDAPVVDPVDTSTADED